MRPVNAPVRKTVIAVTAVAALSGAGIAAPAIVSAATDGNQPTGRTVVDIADDHVRQEQGRHHLEPGDDRSNDANETDDSGFDSPHDRSERTAPNGRHLEPGDDHGNHAEPGDDHGDGDSDNSGPSSDSSGSGSDDGVSGSNDSSGHGGGDDSSGHGGGDD